MTPLSLHLPDGRLSADLDMSSGILRLSREDRARVLDTSASKITLEVDGLVLEGGLIINRLSQRILVSDSALSQIQAIMAG